MKLKFRKSAVASIAAMTMICSSLAGICYAENEIPAEETVSAAVKAETKKKLTEITAVKTDFDRCVESLAADDGQVYYIGHNEKAASYIFTLDEEGNVSAISMLTKNYANPEIRQAGGKIFVFYNAIEDFEALAAEDEDFSEADIMLMGGGIKDLYMIVFDRELNRLGSYDMTSISKDHYSQFVGVNSGQVCYSDGMNSRKLYISNYDGSDKKLLLDMKDTDHSDLFIDSVAMTETHAAVTLSDRRSSEIRRTYCGVVDLETGEFTIERHDDACSPEAYGNIIRWDSNYDWITPYQKEGHVLPKELVLFDGNEFRTMTTERPAEIGMVGSVIDSDGRIVTCDYGKNRVFRVYENGVCIQTIRLNQDDYCPDGATGFTMSFRSANKGIISVICGYFIDGKYYSTPIMIPYGNE